MKLLDKVAVVTGASSGMGRAIALLYAKEGAKVVAVARRKEKLAELSEEASAFGGEILAFEGDISKKEDIESMIDTAISTFGKLDILVNNAGIMDRFVPVGEVTDELWDQILSINLTGTFYAMRKAVNVMLKQGSGNIINVSSVGGLRGGAAGAAYTSSKHAVVGLSKNTAYMYANSGIRCNVICPGGVETEITQKGVGIAGYSEFGMGRVNLGTGSNPRMGTSEEIANVALFLASDDSSFVNGIAMPVDSGWLAY